jgi:hypothetical protein
VDTSCRDPQSAPELSIHRAFVIHFYADRDRVERDVCRGRIEHVVSGEGGEFESVEDLLRIVRHVLRSDQ